MRARISCLLISAVLTATLACAEDLHYKKYHKRLIATLEWGTGAQQIDGFRADAFPPGPNDLCVDEKNGKICIPKNLNERIIYNIVAKKIDRIITQDSEVLCEYNMDGLLYLCYWKGEEKCFITINKDGKIVGGINLRTTIRRSEFAGDISIDEKGHIWMGQYWGPVMEFDKQGGLVRKMPEKLFGVVRSKGKYYLRKKENGNMLLTATEGKELIQLPSSAVILGIDLKNNCYLHIFNHETSKSHITIVDEHGLITSQYEFDIRLAYDPDNYKQIAVGRSGALYTIPNGSNSKQFEIWMLKP